MIEGTENMDNYYDGGNVKEYPEEQDWDEDNG
jgi:hypothetical protein